MEGHWAVTWGGNGPSDMAMNPNISHSQISSSRVQSMNRTAVSGYYKIKEGCTFEYTDKKCTLTVSEIQRIHNCVDYSFKQIYFAFSKPGTHIGRGPKAFQKSRSHLQILNRRVTWCKFHADDPRDSVVTHDCYLAQSPRSVRTATHCLRVEGGGNFGDYAENIWRHKLRWTVALYRDLTVLQI
jgi:hypothetical protein